jgi:hypothetical protein
VKKVEHKLKRQKIKYLYDVGDLVELARFGFAPEKDEDRVYGTVVEKVKPTEYFVPRYKVRIQYMRSRVQNAFDEYVLGEKHGRIITVMEYDIAGKTGGDSQV